MNYTKTTTNTNVATAALKSTKQAIANKPVRKLDASKANQKLAFTTTIADTDELDAQQQMAPTSKVPAKQILNQLDLLRTDADKHKSLVLKGRQGKETLVAKIYAEFFAAQQLEEMNGLMETIDKALKDKKIAYRSNSRVSTKFVRYVFANYGEDDLSDKEAFKYGRGIDVGYSKNIDPEEFASFVAGSGGYSNIKETIEAIATPATPAGSTKGASKLESLSKQQTVHELEVNDWADDDENYRVYIAVRSDENLALLKAVTLSQDGVEKLMLQVEREQKEKDKPDAEEKQRDDAAYKRRLEEKLQNSEVDLGNKECDLRVAIANKTPINITERRAEIRLLEADVRAAKAELKKFKDDKTPK